MNMLMDCMKLGRTWRVNPRYLDNNIKGALHKSVHTPILGRGKETSSQAWRCDSYLENLKL